MPTAEKDRGVGTHKNGKAAPQGSASVAKTPRSLAIAQKGINTATDFAQLMSSLMSDLIDGSVAPNVGNATCNAGGKLLRIVELQYKYGTTGTDGKKKNLILTIAEGQ
jgi:hypothetical protein